MGSSTGKESACNARDPGSVPGWGSSLGEGIGYRIQYSWASLVTQTVKNSPAIWEVSSVAQLCPTLCDCMDYSPPDSSVLGDSTGKSGLPRPPAGDSHPRNLTQVSHTAGGFFTI